MLIFASNQMLFRILTLVVFLFLALTINGQNAKTDTTRIKQYLNLLTSTPHDFAHNNELNAIGDSIKRIFKLYSDSTTEQVYEVNGKLFKNIICSFNTQAKKRIIIGAHYDACGNKPGADDNASGVAGLLELARLLKTKSFEHRIDLVTYTLEEPPNFRTQNMGSYIHAKYLSDNHIDVVGMICLEMIGYFSEEKHSQDYPIGIMRLFYGSRGNYIACIKKFASGKFARKFIKKYNNNVAFSCKTVTAPKWITGVDFSDHLWYWHFGFSALMLTDTAFYRNKNYHEMSDTIKIINLEKMALVIDGLFKTICLK